MRMNAIAMLVAFPALVMVGNMTAATAAETKQDIKGLYLLTDYPAVSVRPGTTSTISLRLQNYGLPPENFALSIDGAPAGWTTTLLGGGQPVGAAMPAVGGQDWLLPSFLGPVLGGTALAGGFVSVLGTLLGAMLVTIIRSGLLVLSIGNFWLPLFLGLFLLAAVLAQRYRGIFQARLR